MNQKKQATGENTGEITGENTGAKVVPVILSGGSGTRLWPMSRE
ncbi:MAG: hypothetical protein HOO00_08115, partial [Rhodospirillaceae bacterium]|nr:hypothetical protein [Rhodospirillaceae bacterium]